MTEIITITQEAGLSSLEGFEYKYATMCRDLC